MTVFNVWVCIFPGKMGLSWKLATGEEFATKEEAETSAAKNCNVIAVPLQLYERIRETEHRMVAAERKLNEFDICAKYTDGQPTFVKLRNSVGVDQPN